VYGICIKAIYGFFPKTCGIVILCLYFAFRPLRHQHVSISSHILIHCTPNPRCNKSSTIVVIIIVVVGVVVVSTSTPSAPHQHTTSQTSQPSHLHDNATRENQTATSPKACQRHPQQTPQPPPSSVDSQSPWPAAVSNPLPSTPQAAGPRVHSSPPSTPPLRQRIQTT
jgi:hypothetical protein